MTITRKGRWVVTRRDNGQFVSQHDTVDNAIESAYARTFPTNIAPPRYEVVPPETGTATPASAVYWLIDKDPATQEAPQDFDLMPSFNVRAPIRGKVSAVVGATGQANPQLAVPSWSGPPTYNIDQGTIYTNQTIPVYANGKPITVAWVSGIVGGQTVGPPGPNWITFSAASATPTVTFSGHVDADDVTNMVWSATVGNGTPVINPTAGQITVRQSAPVWVGVPTATAIVGQTVDTNVTQVTVVNSAPVTLAWVSGRINGLPVSQPSWLSFVAGYPPIIRCTNPPNENQDITDMVLSAVANGQPAVQSQAGSITVTASSFTVPTISFVDGAGNQTRDLSQYDSAWNASIDTMSLASGSLPSWLTLASNGILTFIDASGSAGQSTSISVQSQASAEADWQTRISDPNVVWYHDFSSENEINNFIFAPGYGTDVNKTQASSQRLSRVVSGGPSGFPCLQIDRLAGTSEPAQWVRPFSPLTAGTLSNGKQVPDPAAGSTLRTWNAANPSQSTTANWPYGYYGHSDYHTDGGWDGSVFYIQFRIKISASRWLGGNSSFGGKLAYIDMMGRTSSQELLVQSTTNRIFDLYTAFGSPGPLEFLNDPQDETDPTKASVQPGGPYAGTCKYPNNNPGNCWAFTPDEWHTVMIKMTPGHGPGDVWGPPDTGVEVWVANQNESSYTKIWNKLDYRWFFNLNFRLGWNTFKASAYYNGQNMPLSFSQSYAQIIFSKSFIPCPAA